MKQRVITAGVLICILIPVLIFSDTWALPAVAAIFSLAGVYELFGCIGLKKNYAITVPGYLISLFAPIAVYLLLVLKKSSIWFILGFAFAAFVYMFWLFGYAVAMRGKIKFANVCEALVSVVYVTLGFSSIILIRHMSFNVGGTAINLGKYFYLLIFLGAWITDTFAYFAGRLFGKHKLIPEISPKKTVEGSIGGILFCVISYIVFGLIVSNIVELPPARLMILLAVTGIVVSVISQIGDLIASLIKREHEIKDYGKIFPGHGGVMDRFDSVLMIAPLLYAVFAFVKIFGLFA